MLIKEPIKPEPRGNMKGAEYRGQWHTGILGDLMYVS